MVFAVVFLCLLIGAGHFLVVNSSLQRADVIVVLSGNDTIRIDKATDLYKEGYSESIMLTNTGQRYSDYDLPYTMLQTERFKELDIPEGAIYLAEFQAKNTGQEATGIISKMFEMSAHSAIIVTDAWHTRRVKTIFSDSFGNTDISLQYCPVTTDGYNPTFWWLSLDGWRITTSEYIRIIGYLIKRSTNIPDYPEIDFLK